MQKLKAMFRESFDIPINQVIPLKENLSPIGGTSEDALLFGSRIAAEEPFLAQGDIDQFLISCPEGYFLVGFWGHGINSYAFYYSRVDSCGKVFFRLPFGGVYADNDMMAKCIPQFLNNYFMFEQKLIEIVESFIAIDAMDEGYYKFLLPGNKTLEFKESLLHNPNFDERFRGLFV